MDIRTLTAYSTTPVTNMVRPARIAAPDHPLADRDGLVPAEVFDLPPEMLTAIRNLPIRPIDPPVPLSNPWDGAPTDAPNSATEPTQMPRMRPLDAPTFELDL